ncbi:ROK family protein [Leadbettera azotonutricia]|uniref:Glucokinase (Glucose kinase) n=1 Tax=Leadbettera azotonutricia (strain ATCC BAA-888 / DSM 13862 / ZAS-9) TaxID=545695 RepID=F5YD60_LEAAZ|nr:ROK family protein [Leadbettera azotonutricia]AEF80235.1 glucokinase (Glucose kinase) [Leadbettera azotonutricia ZAS-9]
MNENKVYIGIDIGGTKTAISSGNSVGRILGKKAFPTDRDLKQALKNIFTEVETFISQNGKENIAAMGISCGGPLDSDKGIIQSPPNLPGWDDVHIIEMLKDEFSLPVFIENDANACALAEWYYGAGRGCKNMIFLTFGTGLGAGLILDGRLYRGANGLAGEVGHIRMTEGGPLGYGKKGSLEGWCSGGGISEAYFDRYGERISGGEVCKRAEKGDAMALAIIEESALMLGKGLALFIDIINPERIVIGSIFARSESLFRSRVEKAIKEEALPLAAGVCKVLPAELGESLGDTAAICAAVNGLSAK